MTPLVAYELMSLGYVRAAGDSCGASERSEDGCPADSRLRSLSLLLGLLLAQIALGVFVKLTLAAR